MAEIRGENERSEVNLGTFYFAGGVQSWNWTAPQNNALWQDDVKTLFDPCPPGWRVPKSGAGSLSPWNSFTKDNGLWTQDAVLPGQTRRHDSPQVLGGTPCLIPACGIRNSWNGTGTLLYSGDSGSNWSTSIAPNSTRYHLFGMHFSYGQLAPYGNDYPAYGFSVRCLRE